jgi:5-methylcytosine-specific restriction endonuclease McrA
MSKSLTLPKLTDKAQKVFNAWIRHRDSKDGYFTCISCFRTLPVEQMNAGHYVPVKGGSALRFNENNVNGECIRCNGFDEFHLIGYRKNLIKKIGINKVEILERMRNDVCKWDRTTLNHIVKTYTLNSKTNGTDNHLPF